MTIRYLSLFSGIEAATQAWHPLGWECVAVSEIEPFPCAVLAHHYPHVPNLGDVTKITAEDIKNLGPIDLVVFGSPCQDLSLAGARRGFTDDDGNHTRSGLFFTAIQIVEWAKQHCGARFALWENVAGAYSSNKGKDFAAVVANMAGLRDVSVPKNGWGSEGAAVGDNGLLEWCCLDAQWSGVAQRRRRVFAIVDFGDWANRSPILLEPHSLRGDTPPSREKGQEVAGTLASRTKGGGFPGTDEACNGYLIPEVAPTLRSGGANGGPSHGQRSGDSRDELIVPVMCMAHGQGGAEIGDNVSPTLNCNHEQPSTIYHTTGAGYGQEGAGTLRARPQDSHENLAVAYSFEPGIAQREASPNRFTCEHTSTLRANMGDNQTAVAIGWSEELTAYSDLGATLQYGGQGGRHDGVMQPDTQVRRLLPSECEKLQGFPPGYTAIPYGKKPAADGPRYKALGNSMAVPCMAWIGKQIQMAVAYETHKDIA